jgi:chromosome partitioning protein
VPLVVAVFNQKGGVGKSNVTANLAAEAAARGLRVLTIDLDPQATLTRGMLPRDAAEMGVAEVLLGRAEIGEVLQFVPNFGCWLLPAVPDALRYVERELTVVDGGHTPLRAALDAFRGAHVAFIDCPPSLGALSLNALFATGGKRGAILVPVQAAAESILGLRDVLDVLDSSRATLGTDLEFFGALMTQFDGRTTLANEMHEAVRAMCGSVCGTIIRRNTKISEAYAHRQPVRKYAPRSFGAVDYRALADELISAEDLKRFGAVELGPIDERDEGTAEPALVGAR